MALNEAKEVIAQVIAVHVALKAKDQRLCLEWRSRDKRHGRVVVNNLSSNPRKGNVVRRAVHQFLPSNSFPISVRARPKRRAPAPRNEAAMRCSADTPACRRKSERRHPGLAWTRRTPGHTHHTHNSRRTTLDRIAAAPQDTLQLLDLVVYRPKQIGHFCISEPLLASNSSLSPAPTPLHHWGAVAKGPHGPGHGSRMTGRGIRAL